MSLENEERNSAYDKLTPQRKQLVDKVMENLEKGNLFWSQGWVSSGAPESAVTGKKYRGINNLFLSLIAMSENYGDNRWATFKQMEEKGWTFKKDEEGNSLAKGKGASIEYYEMRDKETKRRFDRSVLEGMTASEQQEYMDKNVYWLRKFYRVFNCSLMDGVPTKEKPQIDVNDRNDRAEAILDYWDKNEAKIVYGGSRAFYRTDTDEVHLPERADFKNMQEFYSTALHEIGHSTGHESRLNRDLSGRFGSEGYAMEELRAEIASIFMEQDLGVEPSEGRLQNNAAYIQSWKEEIKENPNALFTAITDADKIAKYVSERSQEYRQTKDVQYYAIYKCTGCGDSYDGDFIEAKGHDYESKIVKPTCTAQGYTRYTCKTCGNTYTDNFIEAEGHRYGEWTTVKEPTCVDLGKNERTCSVCSYVDERDTLVLKRLNEELSGLIFKGGTSLSKCHKAINRFSEDIDLTLDSEHLTEGQRKIVKPTIVKICEELGLTINNLENTRSRRDYNCYQISYPLLFENDEIDPVIKAETVFIQECYPEEVKQADSLIGEWLKANGFTKQAEEYGLLSFDIHVQTMERTLVDKVFALCDYMLLDDMQKHSRHIYDIYQLLGRVELNEEFRALIHRVREDRKYHSLCVSAQNNADIPALLEQVIETECYKKDYEEHTRTMLYTPCNYEEAITGLKKIIDSGMFGKDEEYEKNTVHISVSSASKIASYKEYRIFAMPEHDKYGDYAYKIPNKFISINRSEKAIVFHLPKDYVVRLKNGRTNQTAELTVTEFVAEVAGKDESAYGMKIIRPSQTANGGNTPKKKKTDFNSK